MNHCIQKFVLAVVCIGTASAALAGGVTVNYVHPEGFTDMPTRVVDRDATLREISDHFQKLGAALPPGQELAVDVLDIDLAGDLIPNAIQGQDLRLMRDNRDSPLMHLRYALTDHGKVIGSGDMEITDSSDVGSPRLNRAGTNLPHEMRMIDNWWGRFIQPQQVAQQ